MGEAKRKKKLGLKPTPNNFVIVTEQSQAEEIASKILGEAKEKADSRFIFYSGYMEADQSKEFVLIPFVNGKNRDKVNCHVLSKTRLLPYSNDRICLEATKALMKNMGERQILDAALKNSGINKMFASVKI